MSAYISFYEILDVCEEASVEEIKTAFRRLALIHHPDKNNNSPESEAKFIILYQAYSILSDPEKREEYNTYLRNSSVLNNRQSKTAPGGLKIHSALPGKEGINYGSLNRIFAQLNFILWEIEDFLRISGATLQKINEYRTPGRRGLVDHKSFDGWEKEYSGKQLWRYVLDILIFIDKWVLAPSGFPDYFLSARNLKGAGFEEYIKNISLKPENLEHRPFVGLRDYFYNIRKRMDKFMNSTSLESIMQLLPEFGIRKIDCIFEALNFAMHNIGCIHGIMAGKMTAIHDDNNTYSYFKNNERSYG